VYHREVEVPSNLQPRVQREVLHRMDSGMRDLEQTIIDLNQVSTYLPRIKELIDTMATDLTE
jgi:hypothetical protein